ncbi:MAG: cyanophycinase [Woeseia sp.]
MNQRASALQTIGRLICLIACATTTATVGAAPGFEHFITGNPLDVVTETGGLIVLQGGGDDVDINYVRMGEESGGGDFVVLRASGSDEYNDYIFALCGCDSVATLVFSNRDAAFDPFVSETIRNAEALFIAGGDQSRYLRFWQGTPVEDAINSVAAKPAPIGGTSAGMAILGEFVYSAMSDTSLSAATALQDPYHEDVTLARDFLALPMLQGVITDQHLKERDRIGRTVALLARLARDEWTANARAIAADRETALHVDPVTGHAQVYATQDHATPYVWFMQTSSKPVGVRRGMPLSIRNIEVYRIAPGASFNLTAWSGDGGIAYTLNVDEGTLKSSRTALY